MNEEQSSKCPEKEERIKLTKDWVILEVTLLQHAGRGEGKHETGVDEVGCSEEDDEDGGGVAPGGGCCQENIESDTVEDCSKTCNDGSTESSNIELTISEHSRT